MNRESDIRLIVGLGNIGEKYNNTPHNLGRKLIESIRLKNNLEWMRNRAFDYTESLPSYARLHCYMNLSGKAVGELLGEFKCGPGRVLVCCDDFTLPLGMIRIRKKGSAGGHNGLKSIIEHLQTDDFPRLRLGIGAPEGVLAGRKPEEFVLSRFSSEQLKAADAMVEQAALSIQVIINEGLESSMNRFNKRKSDE